jgi:hypothetical protein
VDVFAASVDCTTGAKKECYFSFKPAGQDSNMHYFSSVDPKVREDGLLVTNALVVMHGHPRDVNKTFNAGLAAIKRRDVMKNTLVVAPIYQVPRDKAKKCMTKGVPLARAKDLTWTCQTWMQGGLSNGPKRRSSFAVMDALIL